MKNIFPLILTIFLSFTGMHSMAEDYQASESFIKQRTQLLELDARQINPRNNILAVLMETGYGNAVATVTAVADGSTSIYVSHGGGLIGAGEFPKVRNEAYKLIDLASNLLDKMKVTKDFPLPQKGHTRFYVVTEAGVYTIEVAEKKLGEEKHALSEAFVQGHKLIAYISKAESLRNEAGPQ